MDIGATDLGYDEVGVLWVNEAERPPVFIVGSGRSGTTLLRAMLNVSDEIHIPHESDFVLRAAPFFERKRRLSEADLRIAARMFILSSQDSGWGMPAQYIQSELLSVRPSSFAGLNDAIYRAFLKKAGMPDATWALKSPVLIAGLDVIHRVFPTAKVINLIRDGRDVHLSYEQVHSQGGGFGPNTLFRSALYWADAIRRGDQVRSKSVLTIRYEDLVTNPTQVLRAACQHIGIAYSPEMHNSYQDHQRNRWTILREHRTGIHKKVLEGVDRGNTNKYLRRMSKRQLLQFELLVGPLLQRHGYESYWSGAWWSVFARPVQPFLWIAARIFNNIRYQVRARRTYKRARDLLGCTGGSRAS